MTAKKIARRLTLIAPLAHRRSAPLPPLRFKQLAGPGEPPPLDAQEDGAGWQVVLPNSYWGGHNVNFALRGEFTVPPDFAAAIDADPTARQYFDGLSYSNQRRFVMGVDEAKTPETRARRIAKSVGMLHDGRLTG